MKARKKTILLVDGDIVAFRYSAGVENRKLVATHIKTGIQKSFANKTEMKNYFLEQNKELDFSKYNLETVQEAEDISVCLNQIKNSLEKLQDFVFADEVEIWLGEGENFRHRLPLPSPYKDSRSELIKPLHIKKSREYLSSVWKANCVEEIESDDALVIRAYEEKEKGNHAIIVTNDKDAMQSQGITLLDPTQEEWSLFRVPEVGSLRQAKSSVKGAGLAFLCYQLLAGDPVDTYKPYELSKIKYGPQKAYTALKDATTEQELLQIVVNEYDRLYPETVEYLDFRQCKRVKSAMDLLRIYFKCAYMKRSWDDKSEADEFFGKYGVQLK